MSKIGYKIITIPDTVNVDIDRNKIIIKGKEGQFNIDLPVELKIEKEDNNLTVGRLNEEKKTKAKHGLYRQIIYNAIVGVEKPWFKKLEVVGTGYNAKLQGEDLVLKVGYSHPVVFEKANGVKYQVENNNKIIVFGIDKQLVGQIAHQIKMIKKPDVYKGKGIKYEGEKLRIKPGKKAKAAGAVA